MAYTNFNEIEDYVLGNDICKTIVLCGSQDSFGLSAVVEAKRKGIVKGILIGDEAETRKVLDELDESPVGYEFINETDEAAIARLAIELVRKGDADMPMKGLMQTGTYMRAILDKDTGILPKGRIVSEVTPFIYPEENRIMFVTDCAVNIDPNLDAKVKLIENAVEVAHAYGFERPRVACLAPVEKVNPKIQATVDADALSKMDWEDCVVEGPFAFDNAVNAEAAAHKGITGEVAGKADILLCSDLCMGNVIHKAIHFFAHFPQAVAMCGTDKPFLMPSRTDTPETKYHSILTAILQSLR